MATINLSNAKPLSPIRLSGNFKLRIKEEPKPHVKQDTGARSLKFLFEIVEPHTKVIDGVERSVAGIEITRYVSVEPNGKDELRTLASLHRAAGLPLDIEFDDNQVPVGIPYAGQELWAECSSQIDDRKDPATGEPIVNPNTGEPSVRVQHNVREFHSK